MRERLNHTTNTESKIRQKIDLTKKIETKTKTTIKRTTTTTHFYQNPIFNQETLTEEENTELEETSQNNTNNDDSSNDDYNNNDSSDSSNETQANDTEKTPSQQNDGNNGFTNGVRNAYNNIKQIATNKATKKATTNAATKGAKTKATSAILKNPVVIKILLIILVVVLCFLGLLFIIVLITGAYESNSISFGGYYSSRCDEMTVIFVDKNNGYAVTGSETYSMEDYVAGVVYAEVGGAHNMEVYKTFAVAARTFGLKHASDDCSIEGSARRQAFKDVTAIDNEYVTMIYEAVKETEGQVIMSNGELYPIMYDAFCYVSKNSNYYILSQKNQQIPIDWVENNIKSYAYKNCPCNLNDESMTGCWSDGVWQDGGHGKGMSQYGSYYLAKQQGYTYEEILSYYYGEDEISISSSSFMTSIAGLEIKDTTKENA